MPGREAPARLWLSVVIATYQRAHVLAAAVDSALNQSVPPAEVVVCDDGSTDDTARVLATFGDRVRVVSQENRGEAAAKNAAVRAARGDHVLPLDSDDVFLPGRLAAIEAALLARPDLDIVTTNALIELDGVPQRPVYGTHWVFPDEGQRLEILRRNFLYSSAAVRREAWLGCGGAAPDISHASDWDLWRRLIFSGAVAGCVEEVLASYRLSSSSMSSDRVVMARGRLQVLDRALLDPRLEEAERQVGARTRRDAVRVLARERLHQGLDRGGAPARRAALPVLTARATPWRTRLLAGTALASPSVAARWRSPSRELAAGIHVERVAPEERR
jgi:hypothetical protein